VADGYCAVFLLGDFTTAKSPYLVSHDLRIATTFPAGASAEHLLFLLAPLEVKLVEADSAAEAVPRKGRSKGVSHGLSRQSAV
jgi:hypothetical protein